MKRKDILSKKNSKNIMNSKIFYIKFQYIFILLLMIGFAGAESIGDSFTINQKMKIYNYCMTNDCTYMTLTTLKLPDGTVDNINSSMLQNGQTFSYNYTPSQTGEYIFITCADPLGIEKCENDTFTVSGGTLVMFVIVFLIFYILTFVGIKIENPWVTLSGCIGLLIVGIYTSMNGVDIYKNQLTQIISYVTLMIGLGLGFECLREITYL